MGTLARLASTFSGDEAIEAYERIFRITQRIQEEIIKRSEGDLDAIDALVEEAHEGAFDVRRCGGVSGCEIIGDIVHRRLSQSDFQKTSKGRCEAKCFDSSNCLCDAARTFWKALAAG